MVAELPVQEPQAWRTLVCVRTDQHVGENDPQLRYVACSIMIIVRCLRFSG